MDRRVGALRLRVRRAGNQSVPGDQQAHGEEGSRERADLHRVGGERGNGEGYVGDVEGAWRIVNR